MSVLTASIVEDKLDAMIAELGDIVSEGLATTHPERAAIRAAADGLMDIRKAINMRRMRESQS